MGIYKYLTDKIEGSHGQIKQITVLALDMARERATEEGVFSDFIDNHIGEDFCKVFGLKTDEKTTAMIDAEIDDGSILALLCRNDRDGFLAECHYEQAEDISFGDDGKPKSWSGSCASTVVWIYAHTLGELVDKHVETGEKLFAEWCDNARRRQAVKP